MTTPPTPSERMWTADEIIDILRKQKAKVNPYAHAVEDNPRNTHYTQMCDTLIVYFQQASRTPKVQVV